MANNQVKRDRESKDALTQSQAFFKRYRKSIVIAVIAFVVIIVGAFFYKACVSKPRAEKASTELGKGQQYFNEGDYEKALNGDKIKYGGFVKIASDYDNTDAGNLTNLYAGLCYASLGKWKEAVKYLSGYNGVNDAMVSPAALAAPSNTYTHLSRLDKAVENLRKVAKKADSKGDDGVNNSLSPTFLVQAIRTLESQNKKSDALTMYQDIKKTHVGSTVVQSGEIDKYIERVSR